MPKNKVSEWSSIAANNTDIGSIDIAEGCAPSGINNAIREMMAQVKDMQSGTDADNFTIGGNLSVTGTTTLTGIATFVNIPVLPTGTNFIPSGVIVMWSGSIASIPSGWFLCDGNNGTPNLVDRFIICAGSTYAVNATGGSSDAIVVSHTHTATVTDPGHFHVDGFAGVNSNASFGVSTVGVVGNVNTQSSNSLNNHANTSTVTTGITVNNSTTGSSGTNANLPPYFSLAYIMKS